MREERESRYPKCDATSPQVSDVILDEIVLAVCELPDRTSPDDWPEAMLVTPEELKFIIRDKFEIEPIGRAQSPTLTAEGMIRQLQNFIEHGLKPTAIIKSWDGDSGEWQPVTGFLYDADSVELQTDSDEEAVACPSPATASAQLDKPEGEERS
jgi:hypothetical protein